MTIAIVYVIFTYLIASIPFSLVLGYLLKGEDIRQYGDGNPGATNLKELTGSTFWYVIAIHLDGFKGLFPVGIPYWFFGWQGHGIVAVAIAAIAGHAFSVYLGFSGGKAVAITGGIWTGLLILEGTFIYVIALVYWYRSIEQSGWVLAFTLLSLLLYIVVKYTGDMTLVYIWIGNAVIVLLKHGSDFTEPPRFRPWLPFMRKDKDI
jgi:acyl phosphate:glycerol-3-phosphate acyltransferase